MISMTNAGLSESFFDRVRSRNMSRRRRSDISVIRCVLPKKSARTITATIFGQRHGIAAAVSLTFSVATDLVVLGRA